MSLKDYHPQFYFFIFLFFLVFLLIFFIFLPFIQMLVLAMVLATTFSPFYEKILNLVGGHRSLASVITTLTVLALVVVPTVFLGIQIFHESTDLYSSLTADGNGIETFIPNIIESISNAFPQFSDSLSKVSFDADLQIKAALSWIIQNMGSVFSSATTILVDFLILIIALYYMLRDGEQFKNFLMKLSPLPVAYDEKILDKLKKTVHAIIGGMLVIATVQGILTSLGFAIFGIPNAILWGSLAAITSLIPNLGTSLVVIPGIIYLYLFVSPALAMGLLIWGLVVVGLVDNYLGPKLVERKVGIHPFMILLSILGGISYFGPVGFIFGPLALSLFIAMLDVYSMMTEEVRPS